MLQQFAATHNVKAVTVLIGANNYGFADIVQTCIEDFLPSPSWWPNYCNDDSSVKAYFTSSNIATADREHQGRDPERPPGDAERRLRRQRRTRSSCRPTRRRSRTARGSATRSRATPGSRPAAAGSGTTTPTGPTTPRCRRSTTRCATRPTQTGLPTTSLLDDQNALVGRRLCENTVGLLEEKGVTSWTQPAARRQDRVGQPGPHDVDAVRSVPAAGGRAPELLGSARAAQLPAPGVQRRRAARRVVRSGCGRRQGRSGRAEHQPELIAPDSRSAATSSET